MGRESRAVGANDSLVNRSGRVSSLDARMAEWQTRAAQNRLSVRTCGFKSHSGHVHIPSPATTVVVVPREAHTPWPGMLEMLVANTEPPYRLVVIDGGSPPRVSRAIEELAVRHDFTLVRSDALLTSNEARNLGMRHVKTEFAVFIDNDTLVPPGWLPALEQCARETGAPLVAPVVLAGGPGAWEIHAGGGDAHVDGDGAARRFVETNALLHHPPSDLDGASRQRSEFVELHCLLARTDVLGQVGPFDERLVAGREHSDLVLRVAETGGTPLLEPAVTVQYTSRKHLSLHDYSFYLPRWSDECARTSFAHFNERWELRDTSIDSWFLRGTLAHRLRDHYRTRTGVRLWGWRMVRRARRAIDKVATPVALATSNRARARCEPARLVHRATWSEA
jgi:glycosyltransferase involved in cell wall biosynthesis